MRVDNGSVHIISGQTNSSVAAWFTLPASSDQYPIYSERGGGNDIFKLNLDPTTGRPGLVYRDDAGTLSNMAIIAPSGTTVGNGTHFVVMTKAGTLFTIYLDGVSVVSGTVAVSDTLTNAVICGFGGNDNDVRYLPGKIQEGALWNRALSAAEVAALYQIGTTAIADVSRDRFQFVLRKSGILAAATNVAEYYRVPYNCSIDEVQVHVGTAPLVQAIIIDINDDGTTIFTTQANRPSIGAGTNDATSGTPDGGTNVLRDSVITVDVDQVGIGTLGSDLTVHVRGRYL